MEHFGERPPPGAAERAIGRSGASEVLKVVYLDESGQPVGEWASKQIPEESWTGRNAAGLQEPPFPMEQLVYLAESHPVHSSALEQKSADICGKGWSWVEAEGAEGAPEEERAALEEWWQSMASSEEEMQDVISAVQLDVETVAWGMFEVARDPSGAAKRVYHVPAHTVRAHRDGFRLAQQREGRRVWFRRWGAPDVGGRRVEVDAVTGSVRSVREPANDLFVVRRRSRRSTWYGIPGYVSAVGWIVLALAARDDNLLFFTNRREPRWAIILTGVQVGDDTTEMVRRAFTVDLKQPHRNVLIPLTEGPGKIEFHKLTDSRMEGSFEKLSERADSAIVVAHRIPGDRIANVRVGPLGGNVAEASNRIYKEAVVAPGQEFLNVRLNRFVRVEYARARGADPDAKLSFRFKLDDLDLETDREELDQAVVAFKADLLTLREARKMLGREPLQEGGEESPLNDMLYTQLPGVTRGDGGPAGEVMASRGADPALALIDADVRELLRESRDVSERLAEMAGALEDDDHRSH